MKKLALIALLAASGAVFAGGGPRGGSSAGPVIDGESLQVAAFKESAVMNVAKGDYSKANQNISSNAGKVKVSDDQEQITLVTNSKILNKSSGHDSLANQNLSSNVGNVKIKEDSTQVTLIAHSYVANLAKGHKTKAVQNIASNNGCDSCK